MDFTVQLGGYAIFIILGYLLSTENIDKKYRIWIYVGALIGILYRFISTFILSKQAGIVVKTTWCYTSWHSLLLTSAVFLFVKNIKIDTILKGKDKLITIIKQIANCSFGIYLIHQIVMYYEKSLLSINTASWEWRTFGILTTYIICLMIILILKKIPLLRKIVP